jgi:hypothetical protein
MNSITHTVLMFLLIFNGFLLAINCVTSNWFIIPVNLITIFIIVNALSGGIE